MRRIFDYVESLGYLYVLLPYTQTNYFLKFRDSGIQVTFSDTFTSCDVPQSMNRRRYETASFSSGNFSVPRKSICSRKCAIPGTSQGSAKKIKAVI